MGGDSISKVAAIVVSWNNGRDLGACLDALLAQDHAPLEVIVVDNASEDDSRAVAERSRAARPGRVTLVANRTNRGFAGGVNDGLAVAGDVDAVLLVNPDAVARPDHLRRLVDVLRADPSCGAVQGKLLRAPGAGEPAVIDSAGHAAFRTRLFRNRGEGQPDRGQWDAPGEVFGVSGALALYRWAMLDDVALRLPDGRRQVLDETLFAYFEDVDLDWRARLRGWRARYEPLAVATHERGGAGPRRSTRVEALNWRNRLLVVATCDHGPSLLRALPGVLATTVLKTVELALTEPAALPGALRPPSWRWLRDKRQQVQAGARVPPDRVAARWFARFDYGGWVATWWRRVRA